MFKDLPEGQTHSYEDNCGHKRPQETVSYYCLTEKDYIEEIVVNMLFYSRLPWYKRKWNLKQAVKFAKILHELRVERLKKDTF